MQVAAGTWSTKKSVLGFPMVSFCQEGASFFGSVQLSCSVVSNAVPHGLQHASRPCPSPTPRDCSNSCPLSWWCHPTISSSAIPFSSCLQSFPASDSFQMSQFFTSGGLRILLCYKQHPDICQLCEHRPQHNFSLSLSFPTCKGLPWCLSGKEGSC